MDGSNRYYDAVNNLLNLLVAGQDPKYGFGSMSASIYDTAWVSMVESKEPGDVDHWLFPESFFFILDQQEEDGGWPGYTKDIGKNTFNRLLNSLAAILSVKRHLDREKTDKASEYTERMNRAKAFLVTHLACWDIDSTTQVGFEIIVPAMLRYLCLEGITIEFPGREKLQKLEDEKLAAFDVDVLLTDRRITVVHSLEAFVGKIDFNLLRHHKTFGSMMASPSATAAYLMNISERDTEAEDYLRFVVGNSDLNYPGSVPSAFPSTYFEYSWVVCNLLESGLDVTRLDQDALQRIKTTLEQGLSYENGLLGFAPSILPDADDTAKALIALDRLGASRPCEPLIEEYETSTHFKTYSNERNPSFSANCNVLSTLLSSTNTARSKYSGQIEKCARFICRTWWCSNQALEDKWNISPYYSSLLMTQSLTRLLQTWDSGNLPDFPSDLLEHYIPICLTQALVRILQDQKENGSWNDCVEETSYAITSLAYIFCLPFLSTIESKIHEAVHAARVYLKAARLHASCNYLWIEKVSYGSTVLSESYCLGALNIPFPALDLSDKVGKLVDIPSSSMKLAKLWQMLPLYRQEPKWKIQASLIEAYIFLPQLKSMRLDIFPRTGLPKEQYLEFIPFSWTSANILPGAHFSAEILWDMMVVSLINFQVDEYMETVVEKLCANRLDDVKAVIDGIFDNFEYDDEEAMQVSAQEVAKQDMESSVNKVLGFLYNLGVNPFSAPTANGTHKSTNEPPYSIMHEVRTTLEKFVKTTASHRRVIGAHPSDKAHLLQELKTFLLAHVHQAADNQQFSEQPQREATKVPVFKQPRSSFMRWVKGDSADHTSCNYSFAFFTCLLPQASGTSEPTFNTAYGGYIAQDLCTSLAATCRIYNDIGSFTRDAEENNVNSRNFPEFTSSFAHKEELLKIAGYEQEKIDSAFKRLEQFLRPSKKMRIVEAVKLFTNVTNSYGQIYLARDIGTKTKVNGSA